MPMRPASAVSLAQSYSAGKIDSGNRLNANLEGFQCMAFGIGTAFGLGDLPLIRLSRHVS